MWVCVCVCVWGSGFTRSPPVALETFDAANRALLKNAEIPEPPSLGARIDRMLTMELPDAPLRTIAHTAKMGV